MIGRLQRIASACLALLFLLAGPAAMAAEAPAWQVVADQSRVTFTGRQMGAPSTGAFEKFSAEIRFAADNLEGSRVEVTIDTASAKTGNSDIDTVLTGPKWLAAEEHPTARFVGSDFTGTGDGAYEVKGTLTIRGTTKDVTVPFKVTMGEEGGTPAATATGELTIKRLDYGIGTGEWGDTSIVADEVAIKFEIAGRREK